MYKREQTKPIKVGSLTIGGNDHVVLQSMTNVKTSDVEATVMQIRALESSGCELVRVSCLDEDDARAIKAIKERISIPLVADIHFDYRLALLAVENGADKIRINPGNIGSIDRVRAIVERCKEYHVPIRIGINGGSLEKDIEERYGYNSPQGIFESAKRNVKLLESMGFTEIIVSLKSSNVLATIDAYRLAAEEFPYPLHLGITEAGTLLTSSVRSSIGIGVLLYYGIGNTIRVSISDESVKEIQVGKELLKSLGLYHNSPTLISCPTCGRTQYNMLPIVNAIDSYLQGIHSELTVAVMGCVVNGPSEAKHADIGIAGGKNEVILFKKGVFLRKIPEAQALEELKREIDEIIKSE